MYADGGRVRLLVRKKLVDASTTPSDMVRRRQTWDRHLAGYVLIKEESFTGRLSGSKFAYEYTRGGKPMTALIYYLEADNRTIFSFLFRGPRDGMENLRNQADAIARSFRLKRSTPPEIDTQSDNLVNSWWTSRPSPQRTELHFALIFLRDAQCAKVVRLTVWTREFDQTASF